MARLFDINKDCEPIDLGLLVEKLSTLRQYKNDEIVKPENYRFRELAEKRDFFEEGLEKSLLEYIEEYNGLMLFDKQYPDEFSEDKIVFDVLFRSIIPKSDSLIHQAWFGLGKKLEKKISQVALKKVIGSLKRDYVTYLKERDLPGGCNDDMGNWGVYLSEDLKFLYTISLLFEIDTQELLKTRNIFYDPEGLAGAQFGNNIEYKKTYMVFGGIPCQTIKSIKVNLSEPEQISDQERGLIINPSGKPLSEFIEKLNLLKKI